MNIKNMDTVTYTWSDDDLSNTGFIAQESTVMVDPNVLTITSGANYTIDLGPSREEYHEVLKRLDKLETILSEELKIRSMHPTVKQAYDEYKLLLALASSKIE
jgi:hypothetical protein